MLRRPVVVALPGEVASEDLNDIQDSIRLPNSFIHQMREQAVAFSRTGAGALVE